MKMIISSKVELFGVKQTISATDCDFIRFVVKSYSSVQIFRTDVNHAKKPELYQPRLFNIIRFFVF
ncbi:MAG: hypothetical protein CVT92_13665 [Bacteroidetes bacterium HGW-Bacteroidetes-1]|nr:MAG: hypothetical protein CVT92_13665 [Bacteroidetes bacterium HGW-Bacteroidetes-1]